MTTPGLLREYDEHLRLKKGRVAALFGADAGGLGGPQSIEPCRLEAGYRTQAKYFVRWAGGRPDVTGIDPRKGEVPWRDALWMLPERGRAMLAGIVGALEERTPPGLVTGLELRLEHGGGGGHLTLAIPRGPQDVAGDFYAEFLAVVPGLKGLAAPSQSIERGGIFLRHVFGGHVLEAHHRAFFQANEPLLPHFVETIQSVAAGVDRSGILDLYCGVGLHSIPAAVAGEAAGPGDAAARGGADGTGGAAGPAGPTGRVLGVDSNRWAIESARRNAARHGLAEGAEFRCESVEAFSGDPGKPGDFVDAGATLVFVNPARAGCGPGVIESVTRRRPAAAVLVSCSIDSHRRDVDDFERCGYRATSLRCFDMFPFTEFLESVTRLEKI